MARRKATPPTPGAPERIVDVDISAEMQGSFLEYAYSVIYSRALPDARDGLKPVQRRILFQMGEMGLRPERGHVKSARVVGEVMGRLHPHGDGAIYDALVRMSQPFSLRLPMVDGHGNFGSLDDGPAAMRYTEARLAPAAMSMITGIDEDTVDFGPNYDGREREPAVLPAAIPNLLVNGAAGIAVGMATSMPPHNLGEVAQAARYLLTHPKASLDTIMGFVPGPDFPTGGIVIGLDGIREAYESGRGSLKVRAVARVEQVTARRSGIVITELPPGIGPERVIDRITDLVRSKRLQGISEITDLTDGDSGLRVVIEVKSGFQPEAVLDELYRLTPMEDSFSINNVALVDGQPRTLGLIEMLRVFLEHRTEVVRRRSTFRRTKAQDRLHLVDGLLIAILDIDAVIKVIRASDDAAAARDRLMKTFSLTELQATYILDMPLRRLTKFSRIELEKEQSELRDRISELTRILDDPTRLRDVVSSEIADVAKEHATARRTLLLDGGGQPARSAASLEIPDDPCWVLLSSTGLLARTRDDEALGYSEDRTQHDLITSWCAATARGEIGLVTSAGRVVRLSVLDLPVLPPSDDAPRMSLGAPLGTLIDLPAGERVLCLSPLADEGLVVGTRQGVVKRVAVDVPSNKASWEIIRLEDGDELVGAAMIEDEREDLVFITSDAQLLRFPAAGVRAQGRSAGGVAGIRLEEGATAVFFGSVMPRRGAVVVTIAGTSDALPGTQAGSAKVTAYLEYPAKGRGTGGVRCHRLLKGEDCLIGAWAGAGPARASSASGMPVELPAIDPRRDGSGRPLTGPVAAIGSP